MSVLLVVAHEDPRELGQLTEAVRSLGYAVVQAATVSRLRSAQLDHQPLGTLCSSGLHQEFQREHPKASAVSDAGHAWIVIGTEDLEDASDPKALATALSRALSLAALQADRERTSGKLQAQGPQPWVGRGADVRRLHDQLARIASTPQTTVLILGEPGSGRAQLARELHQRSARRTGPFVELDAGTLKTGEFGERLGAGLAAQARGGTLLIHRVDRLDPSDQETLARLVLDRIWTARPSELELPLAARLVATASGDLEQRVESGRFSEDLFSRLNVMSAHITPLRERGRDIVVVAEHHLAQLATARDIQTPSIDPGARDALSKHLWPGNEVELRSVLALALLRSAGNAIGPEHLDLTQAASTTPLASGRAGRDSLALGDRSWKFVEESLIRRVLDEVDGNRSRAARILGVNRTTLYNKIRSYRIDD